MITECMVFAAGFGTRMRPLTQNLPKPLVPVAGAPLIDHALDLIRGAGMERAVVNTHYRAAQIHDHLAEINQPEITFVHETPEILETGGGLLNASSRFHAPSVATINPDCIWTTANPFIELQHVWDPDRMDALLLLVPHDRAIGHRGAGDFSLSHEGQLIRRGEAESAPYIYASVQIIALSTLDAFSAGAFSLNVVWDRAIAAGRAYGHAFSGHWADVGRPEVIPMAEALLKEHA